MSNLYVIDIVRKRQVAASLFEQLVCYSILEDSKWRLLYLSSLYVIDIFERQQMAASLFEQLVYLQPYYYFSINWYPSGKISQRGLL